MFATLGAKADVVRRHVATSADGILTAKTVALVDVTVSDVERLCAPGLDEGRARKAKKRGASQWRLAISA